MSSLHFVSHSNHKKNLVKIGVDKKKIFNFGGLGASIAHKLKRINKKKIEKIYKFKFWKKNFIVTFHPELSIQETIEKFKNIISACKICANINFFFTYPNFDYGADMLIKILEKNKNIKNIKLIKSFGKNFYSALANCNGIVGNSSSAILEAPSLGIYSLNIGNRQTGRLFAKTIVNSKGNIKDIVKKIIKISMFKKTLNCNLYYKKNTYSRIANKLVKTDFNK
jgi:UDP-hydrolysing UDP-N-acetyl-D-glucosamine 2-epimerase